MKENVTRHFYLGTHRRPQGSLAPRAIEGHVDLRAGPGGSRWPLSLVASRRGLATIGTVETI
jgi:hypothetical protein